MQIVVLADEVQRRELAGGELLENILWVQDEQDFLQHRDADAFIDLEFVNDKQRINLLEQLLPKPVIINAVTETISEISSSFIRINAWNTFLSSSLIEASCGDEKTQALAEKALAVFNKKN